MVPPVTISKDDAPPVAFPTADSNETMAEADTSTTTIVEPLGDGSGNVLVADDADGIAIAAPSIPLTQDALDTHDKIDLPYGEQLSGEGAGVGAGDASVMADTGDVDVAVGLSDIISPPAPGPAAEPSPEVPSSEAIHSAPYPPQHHSSDILPTPSSPTLERDGTDHTLGPVPAGHELKDDADTNVGRDEDNKVPNEDA